MPDAVAIRRATPDEAPAIAEVIRLAFQTVADQIGADIPPLHETAADVAAAFEAGEAVLVADVGGKLVGTVRAEALPEAGVMVRRLAVLPAYRGAGIARTLMLALEREYPDADRFELFTGEMAKGPIALYTSLGYELIEPREQLGFPLVWFEKRCTH